MAAHTHNGRLTTDHGQLAMSTWPMSTGTWQVLRANNNWPRYV